MDDASTLLSYVGQTLGELDSLEQTYTQQKGLLTSTLADYLKRLAEISDTQAIRAQTIRTLYWEKNLSAGEIGKAFGLKEGAVRKLAGKLVIDVPCEGGCGNSMRMDFGSKAALNEVVNVTSKRRKRIICPICQKAISEERERRQAELNKSRRQRNEVLRDMPWEEFIDTEEWIHFRNESLYNGGWWRSDCEICHTRDGALYICPQKDSPQGVRGPQFSLLCSACIPRCQDLIDEHKRERLRAEDITRAVHYHLERYPHSYDPLVNA